MAEKGAYLTQINHVKPSIFDFAAQKSLDSLLYPAVERVAKFLSTKYNVKFVSENFDELFYTSHFIVQLYYLRKFGGTFSETLYGLKRISVDNEASPLTNKKILLSLLFSSVLPYVRNKLDDWFSIQWNARHNRFQRIPLNIGMSLNFISALTIPIVEVVQYLRYLSDKSEYISPSMWASQLKLVYSTKDQSSMESFSIGNFIPQLLRRSLEITAFFIQFCQWWQTERMGSLIKLPVPPAPRVSEAGKKFAGLCPICGNQWKSETVLSVSGFIFCLECISDYLRFHWKCPVTDLPASHKHLIRLYTLN